MTNDDAAKKAEELLPHYPNMHFAGVVCPCTFRDDVAAALRAARDEGRAEYHALLAIAVRVIEGLAEQQAMPDDGYRDDLELLRAALLTMPAPEQTCGRCYEDVSAVFPTNCDEKPETLLGQPIGQYHCPDCGAMVLAGVPHPLMCQRCIQRRHPAFDKPAPEGGNRSAL